MTKNLRPRGADSDCDDTLRMLQEELAQTNREVMALTIELETRLEQLRAAEERYRRLAENAPDIIYRVELPGGRCTFMNPRVEQVLGYAPGEFYADPGLLGRLPQPDDRAALEAALCGESAGGTILMRWQHRNGSAVWIEQDQTVVRGAGGAAAAVECIARDVTERKSLEEQLRQSQKMEAVGRLAGGVAHDFNNLLTVISGYGAQAISAIDPASELYGELREINSAADRAAGLTRQLLAFSRRQVLQPQAFDLNSVVGDMDRMVRRLLGENIELRTVLAQDESWIYADRGQLEQVILNLVINARDAMPKGGVLVLETAHAELGVSDSQRLVLSAPPGRYVTLAVRDTGHGMDEATLTRIFEPFFTTKPKGQGTGLGLSMVYGIVKQSDGALGVRSEPGKGTAFEVFLPPARQQGERSSETAGTAKQTKGSETILVVEDESGVRKLMSAALRKAGYSLLEASNGEEALAVAEGHAGAIHLVISDVVMPGIGGAELAKRLAALRPELKMLFTSGYSETGLADLTGPETQFLQKPFTPATLAAKVREVLDRS